MDFEVTRQTSAVSVEPNVEIRHEVYHSAEFSAGFSISEQALLAYTEPVTALLSHISNVLEGYLQDMVEQEARGRSVERVENLMVVMTKEANMMNFDGRIVVVFVPNK